MSSEYVYTDELTEISSVIGEGFHSLSVELKELNRQMSSLASTLHVTNGELHEIKKAIEGQS